MENIKILDGKLLKQMLLGGADGIRAHIEEINELNVFPVPDGDTGTNMSLTVESGVSKLDELDDAALCDVAEGFSKGSLFGARGNSGVILSQFFAGVCDSLSHKDSANATDLSGAYLEGVKRAYSAVANPVEGTILTVFRESAEYADSRINSDSSIIDYLKLIIKEAERSLERTREMLPALTEADVVDSGGAGYLCIAKGMYDALMNGNKPSESRNQAQEKHEVNYDLFTSDSILEYGYCTECLVRLQNAKCVPEAFSEKDFVRELEALGCNSIVAIRNGDVLKVHAHTETPSDILILCQKYGEFLNVKIENMSLQHSERMNEAKAPAKKPPHKRYGVVTVATGDGLQSLFETLGADVVINGGQTGNPAAEEFLAAFEGLNVEHILVFPNNSNILLTARQAAELWKKGNVTVIPTKTLPQGYAALSVFNSAAENIDEQVADILAAKDGVRSGELTMAIRDTTVGGIDIKCGEYIGILDGNIVTSLTDPVEALCDMIAKIDDIDERELITLFVGADVSEEDRVKMTETIEERFEDLALEVYMGGQEIYDYLISVE